jgi:hypothetical protein
MSGHQIPDEVATAIKKCWPNGVLEQFDTDESYFHDVSSGLERDLRKIRGASLLWQTEDESSVSGSWDDEELPSSEEFQSYHVYFLAPDGSEFQFEDETEALDEPEDSEQENGDATYPGEGWIGCAAGICLAARYAVINLTSFSRYENGTRSTPDVESFIYSDTTGERVDTEQYYRETLSQEAFEKLAALRRAIASALAKHRIKVLDTAILGLPVPKLKASPDVFLEEPLRVRDAFFFRGV